MKNINNSPDKISTYFLTEKWPLAVVTITGLIYNVGLVATPWFEGQLAQCLLDIFNKEKVFSDMLRLALIYVAVIALVQIARYYKRFYVRRFANDLNRRMKGVLYQNLLRKSHRELVSENVGSVMTKAISDVEACAEGMRKFTTEVFDTGVAVAGYCIFLLALDWRLALIVSIFPPVSYWLADRMKTVVQRTNADFKESSGRLSAATLDRVKGATTYRVFGCEGERDADYEGHLSDYEKKAVMANIWVGSMQPLYKVISYISVLFIIWFGARNVAGNGWSAWDIAAFTSFLSAFGKLAVKSSKAAKLFNSVQKAQVSWKRIKPLLKTVPEDEPVTLRSCAMIDAENLSFNYPGGPDIFAGLNLKAKTGQIIGVTGPVACGKTTLGQVFLCENPYRGSLKIDGEEFSSLTSAVRNELVGYLGHDPEILSASIRENISLGEDVDVEKYLKIVCMDKEVAQMPEGTGTQVGSGGVRLSGGQSKRLALARTLAHYRPVLILDDPFSALDRATEEEIFKNLQVLSQDRIIILISHRLYLFPQMDRVIWMENGSFQVGTHRELLENPEYAGLFNAQEASHEE